MAGLEELKSLETLCRLNEQSLSHIREDISVRAGREAIDAARLEKTLDLLSDKLDDVKGDMGNFRTEIDERVEKCNTEMRKELKENYVTQSHLTTMTDKILARITWIGVLGIPIITLAILAAKFLLLGDTTP